MNIVANIENGICQNGAIRAIHGWIKAESAGRYFAVERSGRAYLFKIIYSFPRNDAADRNSNLIGFLAEIVYGSGDFKGMVLAASPDRTQWVLASADGAHLGLAHCTGKAEAALTMKAAA